VAATVPETVVEPVTGSGMGDTMVTFGPPSWADACREFIIVPITASTLNTAAPIRWFLYRFIFALLGPKAVADYMEESAALLNIVIKVKTGGWGPETHSWFSDPSGP
jgi:hypothetical protein